MSDLGFGFYTPEVLAHFQHPHHAYPVPEPDAVGDVGNIACGDMMRITLKIKPLIDQPQSVADFQIIDIGFQTYGCAAAIATSSITTDLADQKTLAQALEITKEQVITALTNLPPTKVHCSILAVDALGEAIYNFLKSQQLPIPEKLNTRHQQVAAAQKILEQRYREWGLATNNDYHDSNHHHTDTDTDLVTANQKSNSHDS